MLNIYVIKNTKNGHQYIDYTDLPLNKKWKEILQNYSSGNSSLYMSMKHDGIGRFKISILEEYYGKDIDARLKYWFDRYDPEYNKDVLEHVSKDIKRGKSRLKWGIQRKHKPKAKRETHTIKCRDLKTGKLKTHHGWEAAAK